MLRVVALGLIFGPSRFNEIMDQIENAVLLQETFVSYGITGSKNIQKEECDEEAWSYIDDKTLDAASTLIQLDIDNEPEVIDVEEDLNNNITSGSDDKLEGKSGCKDQIVPATLNHV